MHQIVITLDKVKHVLRQPGQLQVSRPRAAGKCCDVETAWAHITIRAWRTYRMLRVDRCTRELRACTGSFHLAHALTLPARPSLRRRRRCAC